jgi:hypothetical protein
MLDRFPGHPLSLEACRWLIGHSSSSEARRRQELGQFLIMGNLDVQASAQETEDKMPQADGRIPLKPGTRPTGPIRFETKVPQTKVEVVSTAEGGVMQNRIERQRWYENGLALEPSLASFGLLFANDPATQFGLQSIRRNLGDFATARKWYAQFSSRQPPGPWRDAALAELWLLQRSGPAPKAVAFCRQTNTRPFLDGLLEDSCWQGIKPLVLRPTAERNPSPSQETGERNPDPRPGAREDTAADFPTEVFLTYDREFLYLALRCRHPVDRYVPPEKIRSRDADLRAFDRVHLLVDLDRDYGSYFHFQVDQRGCVFEECCQGNTRDRTWNPRWFVACHSQKDSWQIEAAIPLAELTGDPVTIGKAWAFNLVRVIPGRGVQAFSLPADAEPRPEGMGLLLFGPEERSQGGENPPVMSRVP